MASQEQLGGARDTKGKDIDKTLTFQSTHSLPYMHTLVKHKASV